MTVSTGSMHQGLRARAGAASGLSGKIAAALLVAMIICSLSGRAEAGVNLHNGNYYITYADIRLDGGMGLEVSRTYNSKSTFRGIFGVGWGTPSQTSLTPLPDGSILVKENGGGAQDLFGGETRDPGEIETIKVLLKPFKRWGARQEAEAEYLEKIGNDAEFRMNEVMFLYDRKLLKPKELPVGTILKSVRFGKRYIVRMPAGYCRYSENGAKDYFDQSGRLTRTEDADGNWNAILYGNQGTMARISDNLGRQIDFTYNGQGLLERAKDNRGHEIVYSYNNLQQLTLCNHVGGNFYAYEYDERAFLTSIRYIDDTTVEMRYYPHAKNDNLKSLKERDGRLFAYEYVDQLNDPQALHYITRVTESMAGTTVKKTTFECYLALNAVGGQIKRKEVVTTNGDTVSYDNDDHGYCLKMTTSAGETRYTYDDQHSVISRETPQERDSFQYDPSNHKLTRFIESDKAGTVKRQIQYSFSNRWHLMSAADNNGNKLNIEYQGGDISRIRHNSTVIGFTRKGDVIEVDVTVDGKTLSAKYSAETQKMTLAPGISDAELKLVRSAVETITGYYTVLGKKANVRIAGHPENCNCTTKQYEVPERLRMLDKFSRDADQR